MQREKIRKPQVRLGDNCRNVVNAKARRNGDLGHRGIPIEEDEQHVEKEPVMAKNRPGR